MADKVDVLADSAEIPAGMVEVSREKFFAIVGPLNVHPGSDKSRTDWLDLSNRNNRIGWSSRGWLRPMPSLNAQAQRYAVLASLAGASQ